MFKKSVGCIRLRLFNSQYDTLTIFMATKMGICKFCPMFIRATNTLKVLDVKTKVPKVLNNRKYNLLVTSFCCPTGQLLQV